ncbi:unnamed protein product [Thlaspi arvense]|uniref:FBD domain-containing protein n=1 Tax=Thlaspi arvense TaxID=13288 RepID=A0AAU9RMB8_THLAR|nr:unnamed protein product [Thlaspi arvense]
MGKIIVMVPSLQSLTLYGRDLLLDGLEIDTPSLEYLRLMGLDTVSGSCLVANMPNLEEADLDVGFSDIKSLIGSITSVKWLTLSSQSSLYGNGLVFHQLEDLELSRCTVWSSNLLARLLQDSPNLQSLEIHRNRFREGEAITIRWTQPSRVPQCLVSTLQTFIWVAYTGKPEERDAAVYVLENASRLETARFSLVGTSIFRLEMRKELSDCSRGSPTCQLFF